MRERGKMCSMARKPDTPCAFCGTLLYRGTGSRSPGLQVCRPCRRAYPLHTAAPPPHAVRPTRRHPEVQHVCHVCSAPFVARSKLAKYCTTSCRVAARDGYVPRREPTAAERRRHYERSRPSTTDRGLGGTWRIIRKQVIAEETHCGFCDQPVDKSLRAPHPLSASVDHIVRRRDGGGNERANLRLTHYRCNAADGGRSTGNRRIKKPCDICGGPFWASYNKQRTCSRTCGAVLRRRNAA